MARFIIQAHPGFFSPLLPTVHCYCSSAECSSLTPELLQLRRDVPGQTSTHHLTTVIVARGILQVGLPGQQDDSCDAQHSDARLSAASAAVAVCYAHLLVPAPFTRSAEPSDVRWTSSFRR
jgi:hypothetical protein